MRKGFGWNYLEKSFGQIGERMQTKAEAFLIGGGAMCWRKQKNATKDIDIVCTKKKDVQALAVGLKKAGFEIIRGQSLESAYEKMNADGIWENKEGFRVDLFLGKVCQALEFSENMSKRAKKLADYGMLEIRIAADEDILFFKGITERERDSEDMAVIIRNADVDWGVILAECAAQRENGGFFGLLYNKFQEVKEKYGVEAPIMGTLLKKDREILLKNAYSERRKSGLSHGEALDELVKMGFGKRMIERAASSQGK